MSWHDFHGISLPDLGLASVRGSLWNDIDAAERHWQAKVIRFPIYPGKVERFTPPCQVNLGLILIG